MNNDMTKEQVADLMLKIVEPMIAFPDELGCSVSVDDLGTLYVLRAHKSDHGKIIGKQGETINALRTILRTYGYKLNMRASLKLLD